MESLTKSQRLVVGGSEAAARVAHELAELEQTDADGRWARLGLMVVGREALGKECNDERA